MSEPEALQKRSGLLLESIAARRKHARQHARQYDRTLYDGSQEQGTP